MQNYMLILFPVCFDNWKFVECLIKSNLVVIDEKEVELTKREKFELIYTLYQGESWLGNDSNDWEGVHYKMNSCFDSKIDTVKLFYVFSNEEQVKKIKKEIRNICRCGNHSIHSTDYDEMAKKLKLRYF